MTDYQLTEARNRLDAVIEAKDAKIAELQAMIDKWPKTAGGVTIMPGMVLWFIDGSGIICHGTCIGYDVSASPHKVFIIQDVSNSGHSVGWKPVQLCLPIPQAFSTREAAEAATEEQGNA